LPDLSIRIKVSRPAALVLALILPIFAIAPLFYPGSFQTQRGLVPLWNVIDLRANLGDFTWLPHIATAFDPWRSDGLLPYYLAGVLPFSPATSIKMVLGLALLLGSGGMLLWLSRWLGNPGALVAALVYTYLPYQLATVYVRGAWGETLFWGLLPWACLSATYLVAGSRKIPVLIAVAVAWSLLGLSQLGLTLWAFIFLVGLLLLVHFRQAWGPIVAAGSGLVVAGGVIFFSSASDVVSAVTFTEHFLYLFQLTSAYWGFGSSRPGWNDGLSLQLGLAGVGLTIITVVLWQRANGHHVSRTDRRLIFFLATAVLLILLQLGLFPFVWRIPIWPGYTLTDTLTYPWQLLGLTGLCLSVLAGAALWLEARLAHLPLLGAIILLVILASYSYLSPQFLPSVGDVGSEPQVELGAPTQIALLDHDFLVLPRGHTAGLSRGQTTVPLALHGALQANDILYVNVVWHPLQPLSEDLKVFVHLVAADAEVMAQYDGRPRSDNYPTTQWAPGELIPDSYPLRFPADAPPGPYRVFLGFYDEGTLSRLPVPADSNGRVILNVE